MRDRLRRSVISVNSLLALNISLCTAIYKSMTVCMQSYLFSSFASLAGDIIGFLIYHGKPSHAPEGLRPVDLAAWLEEPEIEQGLAGFANRFRARIKAICDELGKLALLGECEGSHRTLNDSLDREVCDTDDAHSVIEGLTDAVAVLDRKCGTSAKVEP
jgi:hypothetical protein